jgi:hypothetical protein
VTSFRQIFDHHKHESIDLLSNAIDEIKIVTVPIKEDEVVTPVRDELIRYLTSMQAVIHESDPLNDPKIQLRDQEEEKPLACQLLSNLTSLSLAQQIVGNTLSNVTSTLSQVSMNFNAVANQTNGVIANVIAGVGNILTSVLSLATTQINNVNDVVRNETQLLSQAALNIGPCRNQTRNFNNQVDWVQIAES